MCHFFVCRPILTKLNFEDHKGSEYINIASIISVNKNIEKSDLQLLNSLLLSVQYKYTFFLSLWSQEVIKKLQQVFVFPINIKQLATGNYSQMLVVFLSMYFTAGKKGNK